MLHDYYRAVFASIVASLQSSFGSPLLAHSKQSSVKTAARMCAFSFVCLIQTQRGPTCSTALLVVKNSNVAFKFKCIYYVKRAWDRQLKNPLEHMYCRVIGCSLLWSMNQCLVMIPCSAIRSFKHHTPLRADRFSLWAQESQHQCRPLSSKGKWFEDVCRTRAS